MAESIQDWWEQHKQEYGEIHTIYRNKEDCYELLYHGKNQEEATRLFFMNGGEDGLVFWHAMTKKVE